MRLTTKEAFIDSINEKTARILIGDAGIAAEIPVMLLPEGISEGDWVSIRSEILRDCRKKDFNEIESLLDSLEENL